MTRLTMSRTVNIITASIMAVLFGLPGIALAKQASIKETGPDSYNKIEYKNKQVCDVENNNNVQAVNNVNQKASTGDAIVGESGWNRYDPDVWAANGHSYAEWESAVNAYMAQNKSSWKNNWGESSHGGGNTIGGNAVSGNASNSSSNHTIINIDNSGACGLNEGERGSNEQMPKPNESNPGNVLGSNTLNSPESRKGIEHNLLGETSARGGFGGLESASLYGPTASTSGGGVGALFPSTSGGSSGGAGGGNNASIGLTGPDSYNKIVSKNQVNVKVNNNNNVNVTNVSSQNASSGSSIVSGNTKAGSAGSGNAQNTNGSSSGVGIGN